MKNHMSVVASVLLGLIALTVVGCGTATKVQTADVETLQSRLEERENEISDLKSTMSVTTDSLKHVSSELAQSKTELSKMENSLARAGQASTVIQGSELLPPKAEVGECYARVYVMPTYKTVTDTVLKSEASERIEVIPAQYEWIEDRVMIKEEGKRFEAVPAQYEWIEEQVLVREAHKEWKRGRGLVERVDDATGEIMCLVEVPAQYKTTRKQVETRPASVKEVVIPAEYEAIKVRKMIAPPKEKRIVIPAEYQFVKRTVRIKDGHIEWRRVLCETNLTRDKGMQIQRALLDAGHNPGPIDGIIGKLTHTAMKSYQQANNLATGGLTYETVKSLGVSL